MAYILALFMLAIFGVLTMSLTQMTTLNARMSDNFRIQQSARMAAESGLSYAMFHMQSLQGQSGWSGSADAVEGIHSHLTGSLAGIPDLGPIVLDQSAPGNHFVSVPSIALSDSQSFSFTIRQVDGQTLRMVVTGTAEGISRLVAIEYAFEEDTSVLSYAVGSEPRIIIRGNVHVTGDLCSGWTRTNAAPALDINLGTEGEISGGIKTVLSQEQFEEASGEDYIANEDLMDQLGYSEPPISNYTTEDFDTSELRTLATESLPSHDYRALEGFPETNPKKWFNRYFYVGSEASPKVLNNVRIPTGKDAHFKNVTFKGYTYIDHPNNVVFEDCTFEGPVITSVPDDFQWKTNALYFKGNTTITNTVMPESTILAPNFNVNIGDFHKEGVSSESKITGILVGGIVDIRDNALIEGTILSMANLDHVSDSYVYYSN